MLEIIPHILAALPVAVAALLALALGERHAAAVARIAQGAALVSLITALVLLHRIHRASLFRELSTRRAWAVAFCRLAERDACERHRARRGANIADPDRRLDRDEYVFASLAALLS